MAVRNQSREVAIRLGVMYIAVLLAFVGLGLKLIFITKENNDEYKQRILSQQAYDSKTLAAKRGEIIDCNGTILAASKENYDVILDVKMMLDADRENGNTDASNDTIRTLAQVFGLNEADIRRYVSEVPDSQYYVVKKGISYEEMSHFTVYTNKPSEENKDNSLYNKNITGVWFDKYYVRDYPQKTLASDVIGFSRSEGQASYGLEEYYNDILTGTPGRKYGFLSDEATVEVTTIPAVDGDTLVSTID